MCVCVRLLPLTQLVPVGQQDGGAVQDVGQRRLDQLPAGDALDGLGQGRGETVQLVLHQHPLEGLGVGRWGSQIEGGDKQRQREMRDESSAAGLSLLVLLAVGRWKQLS